MKHQKTEVKCNISRREKKCRVCGAIAQSFNFNGLSCESCKTFFRRNAQKYDEFVCFNKERCIVNIDNRRFCKRCRLNKCFAIGMKKELIRGASFSVDEVEKIRITSSVSDTLPHIFSSPSPSPSLTLTLSNYEKECLKTVKHTSIIFADCPRDELVVIGFANDLHAVFTRPKDVFINAVIKTASFATSGFESLSKIEKMIILGDAVPRVLFFRTAFYFHFECNSFSIRLDPEKSNRAFLVPLDMFYGPKLKSFCKLHREFAYLVAKFVNQDETIRDFITILLIFQPKKSIENFVIKNKNCTDVCECFLWYTYTKYVHLLRRYLIVKMQSKTDADRQLGRLLVMIEDEEGPMRKLLEGVFSSHDFNLGPVSQALKMNILITK